MPGKDEGDRDDDDGDNDKPVDDQWWRKSLGPWLDPSRPLDAQFPLWSLTPSHYDDDDDDDDDDNDDDDVDVNVL